MNFCSFCYTQVKHHCYDACICSHLGDRLNGMTSDAFYMYIALKIFLIFTNPILREAILVHG